MGAPWRARVRPWADRGAQVCALGRTEARATSPPSRQTDTSRRGGSSKAIRRARNPPNHPPTIVGGRAGSRAERGSSILLSPPTPLPPLDSSKERSAGRTFTRNGKVGENDKVHNPAAAGCELPRWPLIIYLQTGFHLCRGPKRGFGGPEWRTSSRECAYDSAVCSEWHSFSIFYNGVLVARNLPRSYTFPPPPRGGGRPLYNGTFCRGNKKSRAPGR